VVAILLTLVASGLLVAALERVRTSGPPVAALPTTSPPGSSTPSAPATTATTSTPSPATLPVPIRVAPPAPAGGTPHVMVIVEENHSYEQVIGSAAMPYLNSLAGRYGLATNYSAVSNPSEPNYLGMISGSIWDNPADLTPQQETYSGSTLAGQLAAAGVSWKAYMEDMPVACDLHDTYGPGGYDVNHDPFMYFNAIRSSPAQCNRVVPFTQLAADLNSRNAPAFMYVVPNITHDMHDGTLQQGDAWLLQEIPVVLASNWYRSGGIVVITFDEGESSNHIATIVISASNRGSRLTAPMNHYGLLRGLEETYGVGLLGGAANAANGDLRPLLKP
jgi:phospholipase C